MSAEVHERCLSDRTMKPRASRTHSTVTDGAVEGKSLAVVHRVGNVPAKAGSGYAITRHRG